MLGLDWEGPALSSSDSPEGRGAALCVFPPLASSPLPLPFGMPVGCRREVGPNPGWRVALDGLQAGAE